jgi:hypothetical protein
MGEDEDAPDVRYTVTGNIGGDLEPDTQYRLVGHVFEVVR